MKTISERRKALENHRHSVVFYGGWYVVDNQNPTRTVTVSSVVAGQLGKTTEELAIQIAEKRNENEESS